VSNVDFLLVKKHRSILIKDKKNLRLLLKNKRKRRRLRRNLLPRVRKSLRFAKPITSSLAKKS